MNTESGIPVTGLYADEAPSGYIEPPTNTQFHSGVEPEMTLPAAWWNYFVNLFTNTNIKTKEDITAILAELNNALTTMGITPDPETSNQLATLFQNDVLPVTFANASMNANPYTTSSLVPKHRGNIAINTTTRTIWIATNTTAAAASWSRLWSPENDGSGSGLDADKVRSTTPGARGLQYLSAAAVSNIAALILADLKTVDGTGSGLDADLLDGLHVTAAGGNRIPVIHTNKADLNDIAGNGVFFCSTDNPANGPGGYCQGFQSYVADNKNYKCQFVFQGSGGYTLIRVQANGTWGAWTKLWNAINDGSGSGLDADTVDGVHLTRIIRREDLASGSANNCNLNTWTVCTPDVTDKPTTAGYWNILTVGDSINSQQLALDFFFTGGIFTRRKTSGTWGTWYKIWTESNDGSGSGLDADLVRGTTPGTRGLQYLAADVANIAALILADLKTVDGSGSGLDADLLDGQHASSIKQTVTGIQVLTADPSNPANGTIWLRSNV